MEKIPSGIEGLDNLLFGGFPKGRSTLIAGEPGTGKTTLSLQFLIEGAKRGEKGVFISIDEKPEHIIMDLEELGWDIQPYLVDGTLQILDVTSYFSHSKMSETEGIDIHQVIDDVIGFVKKNNAQRLAIDPIAPLVFTQRAIPEVSEYIRRLVFAIEEIRDCTTLLTSYVPVGSNRFSQHGVEEFSSSGIILLRMAKIQNKNIRTIWIRKMRGTRIDLSEYSFEILPERGIVLRQPV